MTAQVSPPVPTLRQSQAIVIAMLVGLVLFTAIAWFVDVTGGKVDASLGTKILAGAAIVAVLDIGLWLALRSKALRKVAADRELALEHLRGGRLPPELVGLVVIGAALAEGIGLIGTVGFLVSRHPPTLVAPLLGALLLALQVPRRERLVELVREAPRE